MRGVAGLPLEMRVLLGATRARLRLGSGVGQAVEEPQGWTAFLERVDPDGVARLAARHGLEALALGGLEGAADVPDPLLDAVRAVARQAVAGNLERIAELHRVLDVLAAAGVPALCLKGPALAVQAYGDVTLRSFGDVDVLAPPVQARPTVTALLEAGYVDRAAGSGRTPSPQEWYEWGFTAPDGRTLVELHWSLASPHRYPAMDPSEAWRPEGQALVPVLDRDTPCLAPELLLPLLAVHATSHSWGWLEFPASIAGLVLRQGASMDWDAVLERARRWRIRRMLAVALWMARQMYGPFPEGAWTREAFSPVDPAVPRLAGWFGRRLLRETGRWHQGSPRVWWARARLGDTVADRARMGWRLLLAPTRAEWLPGGEERTRSRPAQAGRRALRLLRKYQALRRGGG